MGPPGADGISCWDLNGNRACDDLDGAAGDEDSNDDGLCNASDCQGPQGVPGDPARAVVLGGDDQVLGDLLWQDSGNLVVRAPSGALLAYDMQDGTVRHPDRTLSDEIHYESPGCSGQPMQRALSFRIVDAAVFNNGEMFRTLNGIVTTTSVSRRLDDGSCTTAGHAGDFLALVAVGAKPTAAVMPIRIQ